MSSKDHAILIHQTHRNLKEASQYCSRYENVEDFYEGIRTRLNEYWEDIPKSKRAKVMHYLRLLQRQARSVPTPTRQFTYAQR